jgi:formamidopyrimidine-DNA glycosylase
MPELPEVQTTVNGINETSTGLTITDVWTNYNSLSHAGKDNIKNPKYFSKFKKEIVGSKILKSIRLGKNVLIELSNGKTILTHMKMTGHFMYGKYILKSKEWIPEAKEGPLTDPFNRHLRLVFSLSNGNHLAFSDMRKFAKIFVFNTQDIHTLEDVMHLGPDAVSADCTLKVFIEQLKKKPTSKIKLVLLDQSVIAGIGNIYSDEMLWHAGIHPSSIVKNIPEAKFKPLYEAMQDVLQHGLDFGGDSDSDYRNIHGEPGHFQNKHHAYRHTGERCSKRGCTGTIARLQVAGRSWHFCDTHQVKY